MLDHYRMYAAYNAWANRLVYAEAGKLEDADYRRNLGAFFGSLHGTLNHLLAADRIWMKRFTGEGDAPGRLDAILHEDLAGLTAARQAEDARLAAFVDSLTEERIAADFTYSPITNRHPFAACGADPCLQPPDPSSRPVPRHADGARRPEPVARPHLLPADGGDGIPVNFRASDIFLFLQQ